MLLKEIKIGKLKTPNNVFLAPLAGYTNAVFRQMCYDLGAGLTVTEMVSAKGLCYGSEKTKDLLYITPGYGGIKACQLFGGDPEFMRRAAESEAVAPFDLIDINMGCPMPKIYNNGEGSALMNDIPLAEKIIKAAKNSGKAVSVKFRIGLTQDKIIASDFAKACEGAGADLITVHGRTRDKIYAGDVNFEAVAEAKKAVKIPVIANGGVFCKEDAEITGGETPDKKKLVLNQLLSTREVCGERFACVFMRKMIAFYLKGTPNAAAFKIRLFQAKTTEEVEEILQEIQF